MDRYSALPGPPATFIQVSGSPIVATQRWGRRLDARDPPSLHTYSLTARISAVNRFLEKKKKEGGGGGGEERETRNSIANRENPRRFRFGSRSESARRCVRRLLAWPPQVGHVQSRPPHERTHLTFSILRLVSIRTINTLHFRAKYSSGELSFVNLRING